MTELLVLAVAIFGYALVSRRLAISPVTAPMVFTLVGLAVGTAGLGWFDLDLDDEAVIVLVEATLVLVLFTDAVRIDLRALRQEASIPARLLGIGLPLTLVAGAGAAMLVFDELGLAEALLLAAVLAPTDAALGRAVVNDERLPVRVRQAVNVESGLNDGIALPVVTMALALAAQQEGEGRGVGGWTGFVAQQLGVGVVAGVLIGWVGARVLQRQVEAGHVEGLYRQLATVAIAATAYAGSEVLGGNGFVAAFVAGLAFGRAVPHACADVADFTEDESELFSMLTFLVFGAVIAGPRLGDLDAQVLIYAIASLTVVRMVPVLVALIGSGTRLETRLFLGWFGPRGLASILFALLVLERLDSEQADTVATVAVWTVLLSILAHGVTASPWSARLGARLHHGPETAGEMKMVEELPTRRST